MTKRWIFEEVASPCDATFSYGKHPDQIVELRLPRLRSAGLIPTVLVVHGGFWLAEFDRAHVSHLCARLADIGIATWNLEFRRLGQIGGGYPGTFHDVAAGADLLHEVGDEHGLDLSRLIALGHSAGGHLALWLASRHRLPAESPFYLDGESRIRQVISLAGIGDLRAGWQKGLCFDVVQHLMGGDPESVPSRFSESSPIARLPLGVPQILFHGAEDRMVPVQLGEAYAEAARTSGDTVQWQVLPATGHFELIDPRTLQWASVETVLRAALEVSAPGPATVDGS